MKLRTKRGENGEERQPALPPPTRILAEKLLRHYAAASGVPVTHFRAASRAQVATCLEEMEGDDAAKEARLCRAIDDAIAASRARGIAHPSLSFVFHVRHMRRRLERIAEADHLAQKAGEASGDMFAAGFDQALAEAGAELAAGVEATALERARPFVENRLVTDEARLARFHALLATSRRGRGAPPLAKTASAPPRMPQNAPRRVERPFAASVRSSALGPVCGPEDALRALASLFGTVTDPPSPSPCVAPTTPLTHAERAELETAQELARARWARAG